MISYLSVLKPATQMSVTTNLHDEFLEGKAYSSMFSYSKYLE